MLATYIEDDIDWIFDAASHAYIDAIEDHPEVAALIDKITVGMDSEGRYLFEQGIDKPSIENFMDGVIENQEDNSIPEEAVKTFRAYNNIAFIRSQLKRELTDDLIVRSKVFSRVYGKHPHILDEEEWVQDNIRRSMNNDPNVDVMSRLDYFEQEQSIFEQEVEGHHNPIAPDGTIQETVEFNETMLNPIQMLMLYNKTLFPKEKRNQYYTKQLLKDLPPLSEVMKPYSNPAYIPFRYNNFIVDDMF